MLEQSQIDEARAKNPGGDLYLMTSGEEQIICRRPSRTAFKNFQTSSGDAGRFEQLVIDSTVFPTLIDLHALFTRRPGAAVAFASELLRSAGSEEKAIVQKL